MRYVLAGITAAVVAVAVLVAAYSGGAGRTAAEPGAGAPPLPTSGISVPTGVADLPSPTAIPTIRVPLTREQVIEKGRMWASAMGEDNPVLIDVVLTTLADANSRLRQSPTTSPADGAPEGLQGLPREGRVWLVRMSGSFVPSSHPGLREFAPERGWMFAVVNASTGQTIHYGYQPDVGAP